MSYTVLARRYRSRGFDELVGQEAIARTLENAIAQDRVAHAYLFVGQRGVGKTSMARIFAKAMCGGTPEVDEAIMTGQDTDVIEIDAASNSRVEEARELIANARYRPLRGKSKVYIIDEVHMLSTHAFNALLKTLEEPPEHVRFILCTTETHKVPATIQSRCQRFDFRNLSSGQVAAQLRRICDAEGVEAEDDLLEEVGRAAEGSMRDALSLLDRLMAASEGGAPLTVELLERMLGLPQRSVLASLVGACARSDAGGALEIADGLLARGIAMDQLLETLAGYVRDVLVLRACGPDTGLVVLSGEAREEASKLAGEMDEACLSHMAAVIESVQRMTRSSAAPRALFDAMLVRLAMTEKIADVAALLEPGGGRAPAKKA